MMRCAGKIIGKWTAKDIKEAVKAFHKAGGKGLPMGVHPNMVGHNRRAGCGINLDKLIAKVPEDGEVYEVKCPGCGNIATVRRMPPDEGAET